MIPDDSGCRASAASRCCLRITLESWVVLLILAGFWGCGRPHEPIDYYLVVTLRADDADPDERTMPWVPPELKGRMLVRLNGNPVCLHRLRGVMYSVSIGPWLSQGTNDLEVEVEHGAPMDVRVMRCRGMALDAVLATDKILPGSGEAVDRVKMTVETTDVPRSPLYDANNILPPDRDAVRREVVAAARIFFDAARQSDAAKLCALMFESRRSRTGVEFGLVAGKDKHGAILERGILSAVAESREYEDFSEDRLQFEYGPNLVLVYSGFMENGQCYLFRYEQGGLWKGTEYLLYAYVNGRWVIWNV